MPELPEAETIVRGLAGSVTGSTIESVRVIHPDVLEQAAPTFRESVLGRRIEAIDRRGKNVVLILDDGARIVVNLGMTGRLLPTEPGVAGGESTHPAVTFALDDGRTLVYDDVRRFGRLVRRDPMSWRAWSRRLGPEPLGRAFTGKSLHATLSNSRSPVRSWLLDQRRVAGVGNIYANEALWMAGIHPRRAANSVRLAEAQSLHRALRHTLRSAIASRGTTLRDYRDASGDAGGFGPRLRVYGRKGEPCLRCKSEIQRIVFGNRSAFVCPRCQPLGPDPNQSPADRANP